MNKQYRLDASMSIALFFIPFIAYLSTLAPSIYFGDSSELISMGYTLGLAHPTGFPLYILLLKISTFFPAGDIAFRPNLFSAACAAATIPVLYFALLAFLRGSGLRGTAASVTSFACALIFAFSYTLWSQAVITRVYSLNALFCAIALLLFFEILAGGGRKFFFLLSLVSGLGCGLHLTFVLFSAILWIYLCVKYFRVVRDNISWLAFFALAGLCIYLYIPLRGGSDAVLSWHKISSFGDFFTYITQRQYQQKMFSRSSQGFLAYFSYISGVLLRELTPFGIVLILAGMVTAFIKRLWLAVVFTVIFLVNIALLSVYGNFTDLKLSFRYLIPSFIAGTFFLAHLGLYAAETFKNRVSAALAATLLSVLAATALASNWRENDRSGAFLCYDYAQDLLSPLPQKSYAFITGDNQIYPLAYMKFVKKRYQDIMIFDSVDTIFKDIDILMEESRSNRPIPNILTCFNKSFLPLFTATKYQASMTYETQYGLLYQVREKLDPTKKPPAPVFFPWKLYPLRNILRDKVYLDYEAREVAGAYFYRYAERYFLGQDLKLFDYLAEQAVSIGFDSFMILSNTAVMYTDARIYPKAEKYFFEALKINPEHENIYFNLGSLYASNGMFDRAGQMYKKVLELNPRNIPAKQYLDRVEAELKNIDAAKASAEEHNATANKLLTGKKYDAALAEFRKELELNPRSSRAMFYIGLCLSLKKDYKGSITWYERALEFEPQNTSILNNLGLTYISLTDTATAKLYLQKSLEIDPSQARVKRIFDKIK